jgi:hypothetical protein
MSVRDVLFGYHVTQMPNITANIDHARFRPSFAPLDAVDLTRFDLVVPLRLEQFEQLRSVAEGPERRAVLPASELVTLIDDKLAFNRWLIDQGFGANVPALLEGPGEYPAIRKMRHGDWGMGITLLRDAGDENGDDPNGSFRQRAVAGEHEDVLHLLRVDGRIRFSLCYRYQMGKPLSVRGQQDAAVSMAPADPAPAWDLCLSILDRLGFEGTCCFNYKLDGDHVWLLELNPRFGGSLAGGVTDYVAAHLGAIGRA